MESKTCEIKDKIKLEVDFPEDVEDYHNYRLALNIIKNIAGASIKIVLQMDGNPDQVALTRQLISKIKFCDKVQPLKSREFDMGVQAIKNYFLSKVNEFKISYQDGIEDIKNNIEKLSESSELQQKLESDKMDMINRFLEAKMELQENEIKTRNMQFETLLQAINSNTEEIQRIKENLERNQNEDDQNDDSVDLDAFYKIKEYTEEIQRIKENLERNQNEDDQNDDSVDLDAFSKCKEYIDCMRNNGAQPLHIASKLGRLDVVKKLLRKGANINIKDGNGWTPLYYASESGHLNVVKYLISKNAPIDEQNAWGFTALIKAVCCGRKDVVEFLCSQNASLRIRDQNNRTAVDIAYLHKEYEILNILLKYF